jgi:hypothetical protein
MTRSVHGNKGLALNPATHFRYKETSWWNAKVVMGVRKNPYSYILGYYF